MLRINLSHVLAILTVFACVSMARAQEATLAAPKETPILVIEGKIRVKNVGSEAHFDRAMIEALGMTSITTSTPWFNGEVKFEGVLLDKVMQAVGAEGNEVLAVALNDYRTTIPIADFARYGVVLALKRDGEYMPVSDKGPLFIVYPYDSDSELQSQQFYARSAWQLARLIVR